MSFESVPLVPGDNLFGHMKHFQDDRTRFLRDVGATGPMARVRFLTRAVVFANTPEIVHEVLVEKARLFEKSPGIRLLLYYLAGEGLFTSEGELWKRQRKLMAPLFQPQAIAQYAQCMHDVALRVVRGWREGEAMDLSRETTRVAMGVVGKALFDSDTFDEADELGDALTTALKWADDNAASPALFAHVSMIVALEKLHDRVPERLAAYRDRLEIKLKEPFLLPGAHSPRLRAAIARLDAKIQQMIDERRARPGSRDDLLARLLAARDADDALQRGMSDKQIRDEATTLFVAGHETTATSLAWAFYLLARNPAVRERVQAEVDALPPGPIGFDAAARLSLTLRVFKEAMRLYPPVEVLARRAMADTTLGGVAVPRDTLVFISPYIVHRRPEAFADPERFDPDRFLPEREAARHKSAYLPFGAGPRVCLGNHFALLEGPIVMATLMRHARFDIDPTRVIEPEAFATLRPKGGVPAVVHLRDRDN